MPVPVRPASARSISPTDWFGPLEPLQPTAPIGTQPRAFEFLPGQNLIWQPRAEEPISFQDLIYMADNCDIVRVVIEALKDQIVMRPWMVRLAPQPGESQKDRLLRTRKDPRIAQWTSFFKWPNPDQCWSDFLRMVLEDLFVLDAPSILMQRTRAGKIGALRAIDGQTITRLIDENGFTPQAPDPAYQQILYGQPAVDLSTDDLIYRPRNVRARKIYGFSPVEQIMLTLNIALRRMRFQLNYYTDGNVPEALYTMPAGVTEERVSEFQNWFDLQMAGNLAHRRRIWFIPGDDKGVNRLHFTKEALLKDDADEWFARIVCFAFRISPKELIKVMNRATAQESQDSAEEMGVHVMCNWIAETINYIIQKKAGDADVEFVFAQKREADVLKQAQADKIYVDSGVVNRNEIRDELGADPSEDPNADVLGITTQQGFLPLDLAQKQIQAQMNAESGAGASPNEKRPAASGNSPHQNESTKLFKIDASILPGSFGQAQVEKLEDAVHDFLKGAAERAAKVVEDRAPAKKAAGDEDEPEENYPDIDDLLDSIGEEMEWDELVSPVDDSLKAAGSVGASIAIGQAQVHNVALIGRASEVAGDYAHRRAAELVGKRWKNGKLVENPDAQWRIDKTTRQELRRLIEEAFEKRMSLHRLAIEIRKAGAFSEARAKMIAKTEIVRAQSIAQVEVWKAVGTVEKVRWIAGGANPCQQCLINAGVGAIELGKAFPSGDICPGAHPNCVIAGTVVSASDRVSKFFKRWFEGEIVVIRCLDGTELSITPNHPVLTSTGWVPAGEIQEGFYLLQHTAPGRLAADHPDAHLMPTVVEQVPGTLLKSGSVAAISVPSSPEYFHGDATLDGEIDIVYVDGLLNNEVQPGTPQLGPNTPLIGAGLSSSLDPQGPAAQLFVSGALPEACPVCGGSNGASVVLSASIQSQRIGSREIAAGQPGFLECFPDVATAHPDPVSNIDGGLASKIGGVQLLDVEASERSGKSLIAEQAHFALAPNSQASIHELTREVLATNADAPSEISKRFAGKIGAVQVTNIERRHFAGHVHNLETGSGYYFANGLIVHNCQCSLTAAF